MRKKLRLRFLLISWGLMMILLAALCGGIAAYLYHSEVSRSEDVLKTAVEHYDAKDPAEVYTNAGRGLLMASMNDYGQLLACRSWHIFVSKQNLQLLLKNCVTDEEQASGRTELDGLAYRYQYIKHGNQIWIAATDCTQEERVKDLIFHNMVWFLVLGGLLLIPVSILLSGWASKPIEIAWAKQNDFVSDATHELKTPLSGIRLLTDSILQTESMDAETTREFVQDIGQEAERLSRITENLLRLTRLDSDAVEAAYPVAVSPVLERAVRMLGMVAREKEISLSYETDERAVVLATEDDMHQVIYNLVENGIKYSGQMGFVHTNLHVEGDTVVLDVEDNGIGIPDEDMAHIFERFYRVDKMRSRAVGGTGLGLSIVSDTVKRRGGSIAVSHRLSGSGTVFTVRLPLVKEVEA